MRAAGRRTRGSRGASTFDHFVPTKVNEKGETVHSKVLVTGGAGFIGSHLVDELVRRGYGVRIFDNLDAQVHGRSRVRPSYLNGDAEFVQGDIRDRNALAKALDGMEVVFHLAAAVGVGQSMYEITRYVEVNTLGCSFLMDLVMSRRDRLRKVIVASSMSNYGEGKASCDSCGVVFPRLRPRDQLEKRQWEVRCPRCGRELSPLSTDEDKPLSPSSVYAVTKRDHEELVLNVGLAYGIPTVALRYFNVYGARQSLSNPYTGVAAIFSSRILNGHNPLIFEDGRQSRDFVHVSDIVQANVLALERPEADGEVLNVGTGHRTTMLELAELLIAELGATRDVRPEVVERFREGDIRHCYADITKIRRRLGFEPRVPFREGVKELARWARAQTAEDGTVGAIGELGAHGLIW